MSSSSSTTLQPRREVVRLVVISDTHNRHEALTPLLPPHDPSVRTTILLHCGDFSDRGSLRGVRSFCRWLARDDDDDSTSLAGLPSHFDEVVVIDGNHDRSRPPMEPIDLSLEFAKCNQKLQERASRRRVHFLQDAAVTIAGVRIHGVSWKSILYDKYNGDYSAIVVVHDHSQNGREVMVPDVVMSHLIPYFSEREQRQVVAKSEGVDFRAWQGSKQLTAISRHYRIPLVLSGHVHWGRGAVHIMNSGSAHDKGTWFVNAASTRPHIHKATDPSAQLESSDVTAPVVIEYDTQHRKVVHISCPPH
eukprot:scaffold6899_cov183-Amphora_coffeaeformis.AAC.46